MQWHANSAVLDKRLITQSVFRKIITTDWLPNSRHGYFVAHTLFSVWKGGKMSRVLSPPVFNCQLHHVYFFFFLIFLPKPCTLLESHQLNVWNSVSLKVICKKQAVYKWDFFGKNIFLLDMKNLVWCYIKQNRAKLCTYDSHQLNKTRNSGWKRFDYNLKMWKVENSMPQENWFLLLEQLQCLKA